MQVRIFIDAKIKGRGIGKGSYAAVIEYIKADGQAVTKEIAGCEEQTTYYRGILTAIVKALQMLKQCEVIIYTNCAFVINTAQDGRVEKWKREEWKKSAGGQVKNKELWQQYLDEEKRHIKIDLQYSKSHVYSNYLEKLIKKSQKVKKTA